MAFTYTNRFEVPTTGPQQCYVVPIKEWTYLKGKIRSINAKINLLYSIGFWFLGIAATLLYNALIGNITDASKQTLCLVAGIATLLLGCSFLLSGAIHGAKQKEKAEDITQHMELIEERFRTST